MHMIRHDTERVHRIRLSVQKLHAISDLRCNSGVFEPVWTRGVTVKSMLVLCEGPSLKLFLKTFQLSRFDVRIISQPLVLQFKLGSFPLPFSKHVFWNGSEESKGYEQRRTRRMNVWELTAVELFVFEAHVWEEQAGKPVLH